jgi:hypothetical protein
MGIKSFKNLPRNIKARYDKGLFGLNKPFSPGKKNQTFAWTRRCPEQTK